MRDVSLLLGKYIPKDVWSDFFDEYGEDFEQIKDRFYFWQARGSLIVALWFAEREDKESTKDYLNDFNYTVEKLNPKDSLN